MTVSNMTVKGIISTFYSSTRISVQVGVIQSFSVKTIPDTFWGIGQKTWHDNQAK